MHYQLDFLESLVENDFFTHAEDTSPGTTILEDVKHEISRVLRSMKNDTVAMTQQHQAERYIRQHQLGIVTLMNTLQSKFSEEETRYSRNQKHLFEKIYHLLVTLRNGAANCFADKDDLDLVVPVKEFQETLSQINDNIRLLKELMSISNIERPWREIFSEPVKDFSESLQRQSLTRRRILFMSTYLGEIVNILREDIQKDEMQFVSFLIAINLNTPTALKSVVETIGKTCKRMDTPLDKTDYLLTIGKQINQPLAHPDIAFNINMISLRDQVMEWIERELFFLREKLNIRTSQTKMTNAPLGEEFSLLLNLSVSQLACLLRGLIDAKVILNTNVSEVIRFLSQFVRTKRAEQVSPESLRIKYYDIEEATKSSVDETLTKVILTLRRKAK